MRNIRIAGYGYYLPKNEVYFGKDRRFRADESETQVFMATMAARRAIEKSGITLQDIDLLISASAVGVQPIPCTAALIHEQIFKGQSTPAIDINTTCTSFITSLDTASYLIASHQYENILIVASELASPALWEGDEETCELFSDSAVAMVISSTAKKTQGVIASMQRTWSEAAHSTEILGGLTGLNATKLTDSNRRDYFFKMDGLDILRACTKKLPQMFDEFKKENNVSINDFDVVIPHQASRALPLVMKGLGIPKERYLNFVSEYGNQVSVSVPFMLCKALEEGIVKEGNKVLLCGTAAGLTSNILFMEV